MTLIVGVDAGGTSSRAVVSTLDGTVVGRGRAGGGNPMALDPTDAFAHVGAAVRHALSGEDPAQVRAVVVGMAGSGLLREAAVRATFERVCADAGLTCAPRVVGDVVVAFAAGSASPSGTVLISGTGAISAKIIDHTSVALADGFGWQLGDEGSAFWLGRAACRLAVRELAEATARAGRTWHTERADAVRRAADAGHELADVPHVPRGVSRLTDLVVRHLLTNGADSGGDIVDRLATIVQGRPPLLLAELAPLVSRAALQRDPPALGIVREAARRLARTALEVHTHGDDAPVVLAGSVLTSEGPVRRAVRDLLEPDVAVAVAGDGAGAAAWLALRDLVTPAQAARLHTRLARPLTFPGTARRGTEGAAQGR
ncbi:BadF/BadG/BcrA/BcrD ATPase family protein [Sphaerimonospora mesophila]|uniref:N-acetylglucosamine kinase n=1 Tax=Sphaerimonospora mesophila TaxID=37483 RepID=UPI0009F85650